MPDLLWTVLRRYGLVREPMEELQSRFANSQEIKPPCTIFADGVARTLRALLALDESTQETTVVFVRCETNLVDVAYRADENLLYIHEKWLHAPDSHQGFPDPAKVQPGAFIGQHLVEDLYRRAVAIIWQQTKDWQSTNHLHQSTNRLQQVLLLSRQRLHQMPRKIQVACTEDENTVTIFFYTGHSLVFIDLYGLQIFYLVVLHGTGCTTEMAQLVYDSSHDVCQCPRQRVPLSSRTAIFHDVGEGPWTPMIAKMPDDIASVRHHLPSSNLKAQDGALVGIPPQVATPSEANAANEDIVPDEREADLSTLHAARGQATALTAAMSVIEMPPVASGGVSLEALSSDVVEMPSLGGYNSSSLPEPLPLATQPSAKWPTAAALPLITVTDNLGDHPVSNYHEMGDSHANDVNGTDDPAFASPEAASLIKSASTGSSASSGQCEWEKAEDCGPHLCTNKILNQGNIIPTGESSRTNVRKTYCFQPFDFLSLRHLEVHTPSFVHLIFFPTQTDECESYIIFACSGSHNGKEIDALKTQYRSRHYLNRAKTHHPLGKASMSTLP